MVPGTDGRATPRSQRETVIVPAPRIRRTFLERHPWAITPAVVATAIGVLFALVPLLYYLRVWIDYWKYDGPM